MDVKVGEVYVTGRAPAVARALLAAAEEVGEQPGVVRTNSSGYIVPEAVFDAADLDGVVFERGDDGTGEVVPEDAETGQGQEFTDYAALTNDDLRDLLSERGLPTSGNKPDLVERLEADDAARAEQAEQTPEDDQSSEDTADTGSGDTPNQNHEE
jgi:hypothetical protein